MGEADIAAGKEVTLKDGTHVLIRALCIDDLQRSLAFFNSLPEEDRKYLRCDVTRQSMVERRIREVEYGRVRRLVAIARDAIVADGALELAGHEWASHMGEVRIMVAHPFRRIGLGMVMARELYALAAAAKVELLLASVMEPQKEARSIFRKLGFRDETTLPQHVRDRVGRSQDLILMRCDLEAAWRELETFFAESDWQRTR